MIVYFLGMDKVWDRFNESEMTRKIEKITTLGYEQKEEEEREEEEKKEKSKMKR